MLLPSLLKSGDQVYQKVIKQLYQKMLLLNLLITLLLEEGRIARHFHYVESGMLRQYYYKNGHDITEHFVKMIWYFASSACSDKNPHA